MNTIQAMQIERLYFVAALLFITILCFASQWFSLVVRAEEDRTDNSEFILAHQDSALWQIRMRKTWWEQYQPVESVPMFAPAMATA